MKLTSLLFRSLTIVFILVFRLETSAQAAQLVLNGATITINQDAYLVIDNPASDAITVNSGLIISEGENNNVKWNVGTTTGTYTIPWGYSGTSIPLTFTKTAGTGGSGYFLFSTYHTGWQNSAQLPTGVANINGASGMDNSAFVSDRFWQINAQGYGTKPTLSNVVFTYLEVENTEPNNTITESGLIAKRYNSGVSSWIDNILASTINPTNNTVTVTSVDVANFHNWWILGTTGANRYWVASSPSTSNSAANWSETSNGSGGAGVPTYQDAVIFDGGSTFDCTVDANLTAASLLVTSGYTGTISQGASAITLNNAATFSGGTFAGGTADILVTDDFTLSGTSFTSTSAMLELKSDFIFSSGSFVHNNGTVEFSGTGATQNVSGTPAANFNNILVNNTAANPDVSIQSNQNLLGVLTLAGNAVVDADGNGSSIFTLMSTGDSPTQDASVAILPSGAQITGNVTVQRFMTKEGRNNTRIYRYISSPVQNAPVSDLQNEIPITGSFTGANNCPGCTQSMFSYDESVITGDLNSGYIDFPDNSNTETLVPGRGYAMFVSGNTLSSTAWDVRGPINAGNFTPITLPVTYTSSGNILNDGWNLVGNPFPSTIDWDAASGWTKTNLDNAIYITDNGSSTALQYATYVGGVEVNGGSRYIATGQGFWTKANGSGPALQVDENVKVAGTQTIFFREGGLTDLLRITMLKGTERDETVIHFVEDATRAFDHHADAWKLKNGSFNLSSLSENNELLAINSSAPLNCNTSIKLSVADAAVGQYSLKFTNLDSFEGAQFVLNDQFLNQSIPIADNTEYSFAITNNALTQGNNRFVVMVNKNPPPVAIQSSNGVLTIEYTTNIQWYFNDELLSGATNPTLVPDKSGTYSVVVQDDGCELRGFIELVITEVVKSWPHGLHVYPNPVTNEVFISTDSKSVESVTLMNALGETVGKIPLILKEGRQTGNFDMSEKATGLYLLKIIEGENIYLKKLIKK